MENNNPFAIIRAEKGAEKGALVEIESSRAIAEVQGQVVMAKKFPRDPVKAVDRILAECRRPSLAEQAQYSFPRGGTMVTGPSIRLAETIARNWGNLAYGTLEVDRRGDESTMLAYAWDLETNVMAKSEFKIRHIRDKRGGGVVLQDERDIYELTANQAARRLRACILKIVPGDVVDAAEKECAATLAANVGDITQRLPGMLEKFLDFGVTKQMIEKRLRHRLDTINGPEFLALQKVYISIRDGMATVLDYFEEEKPKAESVAELAAKKANEIKAKKVAEADQVKESDPEGSSHIIKKAPADNLQAALNAARERRGAVDSPAIPQPSVAPTESLDIF